MQHDTRVASQPHEAEQIARCIRNYLDSLEIEGASTSDLRDLAAVQIAGSDDIAFGRMLFFVAGAPIHGVAVVRYLDSLFSPTGYCFVDVLWVEPSERGSGAGRALMKAVERFARDRGCRSVELHANEDNPRATGLYESLGYSPRNDSYGGGIQQYFRLYL